MNAPTIDGLPILDTESIKAAQKVLADADRSYRFMSEDNYVTDEDLEHARRRLNVAQTALDALVMPAPLQARRFKNVLVQDAENRRVELVAKMMAARDGMGQPFRPMWIIDGHDDSETMLAWPNGEIETYASFEDSMRRQRLAQNPWL
jgi:hypothetical protein